MPRRSKKEKSSAKDTVEETKDSKEPEKEETAVDEKEETAVEEKANVREKKDEEAKTSSPGPQLVKPTAKKTDPHGGNTIPPFPPYQHYPLYPPPPGYYPPPPPGAEEGGPWNHPGMMYPPPYGGYPPPYPPNMPTSPYRGMPPPYYGDPNAAPPPLYGAPPGPGRWPPSGPSPFNTGSYSHGENPKHFQGSFTLGEPPKAIGASTEAAGPEDASGDAESLYDEPNYAVLKMSTKTKVPTKKEYLDRRERKNAQSRARAAKLRERVAEIEAKDESERTQEEKDLHDSYQARREKKNNRSRERAIEKKQEVERILSKPEHKRTKIENDFLTIALTSKQRKNQGDRLRRKRIKMEKQMGTARQNMYTGSFKETRDQARWPAEQGVLHQEEQQAPWPPAPVALQLSAKHTH